MILNQPSQQSEQLPASRDRRVDVVRGLAIALMALDHARDYLVSGDPTDLTSTTLPLFLTRWVTHFCAPAFVFLAGTSAFLMAERRGYSNGQLARRLVYRGLLLAVLDITVLPVLWWFNLDYSLIPLGVLWAIGWSLIGLAFLVPKVDVKFIAVIGIALIVLHNLTDGLAFESNLWNGLWSVLHVQDVIRATQQVTIIVAYPLIPWVGVCFTGYSLGAILSANRDRRWLLINAGIALTLLFLVLRTVNGYGEPEGWSVQDQTTLTTVSFLNCTKYPPSLMFLLMTLGPVLVLLGMLDQRDAIWKWPIEILGRAPLFFYLVHIPLLHLIAILMSLLRYGSADWWFRNPPFPGMPEDYGWSLPTLYVVWLASIAVLVPVSLQYQQRRR